MFTKFCKRWWNQENSWPCRLVGKTLHNSASFPYIEGYELLEVHDVIKLIVCSIVRREFWHYEPPRRLIVNNIRVERHEKHVI